MRKINFITAIVLVATLLFSACRKDEPENTTEEFKSTAMTFTATANGGWEGISSVGVYVNGEVKVYTVTTESPYTTATLSSDDPHYWTSIDDVTVTAWWPYTEGDTTLPDVVVKEDQSTQENFVASYFISAEEQTVSYDDPTLVFTNHTARVTIKVTDYTGEPKSVKLTNLSDDNSNPTEIVPYKYDEESYTYVALVAPQIVTANTTFISGEFNSGDTFDYKVDEATEWNAGEEYTYTISHPDYSYDYVTKTYTVYSADGLLAWNKAVQDDLTLNCTLAADIDLTDVEYEWLLVGNSSSSYTGIFEGGDHTITGLTINQSETDNVGLIGILHRDSKVQNLTLENVSITGSYYVGGVVGENYGSVTACYWSDYEGNGIGYGSGSATEVDGYDSKWENAVYGMNSAIDTWNDENDGLCEWKYELDGTDHPTLTKN